MKEIYLDDSYLWSFSAKVLQAFENKSILDRTAFYPQSGGQPSDSGVLARDSEIFQVVGAERQGDEIVHIMDRPGLQAGDEISGRIDGDRRYRFMRGHTACHILSAVIFQETGAKITGNQIEQSRSRVDFSLESFDKARMMEYVEKANQIISERRPVSTRTLPRDEALAIPDLHRLAIAVPDRDMIRVVKIEGIDSQACGGTHVRNTAEVGRIKMIKAENKGKANRRVYFSLED
ncbi:MAG: alanyl-tRNA editing protein [Methanothrix sp.]|nr:alanyl-tRNA editing protein [Methanothrix sp.]HOU71347.1 alanyl-tRNA editing protein AlaXM [Methanothrix sp.]HUM81119.1 alanyl-tRNA editing protein AlaXM [Methanothrix sp.]